MRNALLTTLLASCTLCAEAQVSTTFTSPNGKIKVDVQGKKELTFSVTDDGNTLIRDSKTDLSIRGMKPNKFTSATKVKTVSEHIDAPFYKTPSYDDTYTQTIIKSSNGQSIEFRAYNTGVAYRWITSVRGEWIIDNEVADFHFADDYTAWMSYSTNEKNPMAMAFQNTYTTAPLSLSRDLVAFLPVTVDCKTAKVTILESDVEAYPGIFVTGSRASVSGTFAKYPRSFEKYPWRVQKYVTDTEDYIARGKGARNFPWRIFAITHNDTEMPTNTLTYSLAAPNRTGKDTSWIKPGKVAWDWWNDWGLTNVDFKAGINQQTYKYYIDFAAKNHLEYIVLDEGWYVPSSGDMLTVIPELNLPELVKYGERKGVGIILWTVFNVLDDQLEESCRKYSAMGIKGFKVDFLDRYDQEAVEMAYRIADRCAKDHLVLDYHGIYPPFCINRTYPNIINFESIFGMEEVKWTNRTKRTVNGKTIDEPEKDMPLYDVTFPYIRTMAGFADYTPGGMRNASKADFQPIYNNPMTMGTRCHQMAHYIVHDSPLTMLADNPSAYIFEEECTDFIASIPTVFDEMKVLHGKMGEYIVVARRKGNDWYIAGETNWNAKEVEINTDFLPTGNYEITAFMDGINADKNATDYKTFTLDAPIQHSPYETIKVRMASGGGFAAKIIRK